MCDSKIAHQTPDGTIIGMSAIKKRRLNELTLNCYPNLHVGDCVPFYFCSRSIMLYLIHMKNAELIYQGKQIKIINVGHLLYLMLVLIILKTVII